MVARVRSSLRVLREAAKGNAKWCGVVFFRVEVHITLSHSRLWRDERGPVIEKKVFAVQQNFLAEHVNCRTAADAGWEQRWQSGSGGQPG